jgi:hypothetical protein
MSETMAALTRRVRRRSLRPGSEASSRAWGARGHGAIGEADGEYEAAGATGAGSRGVR